MAKCDVRLFAQVAKLVDKTLHQFCTRVTRPLSREPQPITGMGPVFASQLLSIDVGNGLYALKKLCWKCFTELGAEEGEGGDCLFLAVDVIHQHMLRAVQVVLVSITQELESVLLKLHREDYTYVGAP